MEFFQGFNLDTLLALISCIASVIALFLGGKAYSNCKSNKNKLKTKKTINNSSSDNSFNVGGDYINNGVSETGIISVVEAMNQMTSHTFSLALDKAYSEFQVKCDENLQQIIDETKRIVSENKLDIAGYSKLDWIHIYFESAKNTSDSYMQSVWAKVLAKELSAPNSFSYKTLDALKNMSADEFKLFEKLSEITCVNTIYYDTYLNDYGLNWWNLQRLKEFGLISLDNSATALNIKPNEDTYLNINNKYLILFKNTTNTPVLNKLSCYILTTVGQELINIVPKNITENQVKDIALAVKKKSTNNCKVSLHKIANIATDGTILSYDEKDILS